MHQCCKLAALKSGDRSKQEGPTVRALELQKCWPGPWLPHCFRMGKPDVLALQNALLVLETGFLVRCISRISSIDSPKRKGSKPTM